ncbi:MAG: multicomponent Na+:H+ antiporter subunit G [Candidatus Endobugula sp.]|jgi:multicomponent Na+:H+ antiporter subunit G
MNLLLSSLLDGFTVVMTASGLLFFFAGSVGLLRFPDAFCRLHALTKADNLGLGLIIFGVLPQVASVFDAVQLMLIWLLVMVAGAVGCYLVANQAVEVLSTDAADQANKLNTLSTLSMTPTVKTTINSSTNGTNNGV